MGWNVSKKGLSITQHALYGSWLIILAYLIIGHSIPYSWYVDVESQDVISACVGSNVVTYRAERYPRWDMQGGTYAEVVKYNGGDVIETVIRRGTIDQLAPWTYESEISVAIYDTEWSHPFPVEATYGINSWNTIYPLPFISVTKFTPAEDNKFNVIVCAQ